MRQGRPAILTHLRGLVPWVRSPSPSCPVTAHPYPRKREPGADPIAMTTPDGLRRTLTLDDFLRRPGWHQRAACRAVAWGRRRTSVGPGATTGRCGRCVRGVRSAPTTSRWRWPMARWWACGAGLRRRSGAKRGGGEWRDGSPWNSRGIATWETVSVHVAT